MQSHPVVLHSEDVLLLHVRDARVTQHGGNVVGGLLDLPESCHLVIVVGVKSGVVDVFGVVDVD